MLRVSPWEGEEPEVGNPVFGGVSVLPRPLSVNTRGNAICNCAQDFALILKSPRCREVLRKNLEKFPGSTQSRAGRWTSRRRWVVYAKISGGFRRQTRHMAAIDWPTSRPFVPVCFPCCNCQKVPACPSHLNTAVRFPALLLITTATSTPPHLWMLPKATRLIWTPMAG